MPIVRGSSKSTALTAERRAALLEQLSKERAGQGVPNGPMIFEIPLEQSNRIDVLVVWDAFQGIRSEERTELILSSYHETPENIAQALGVTYQEAMDQQLLPYAVIPMTRKSEVPEDELRRAMLNAGGFALPSNKIDLRFPTMEMAETAHSSLCDHIPQGHWSIVQELAAVN